MRMRLSLALFSVLLCYLVHNASAASDEDKREYVKEWALRIAGGERVARDVAENHGFQYVRKVRILQ